MDTKPLRPAFALVLAAALTALLGGCASLGAAGPGTRAVLKADRADAPLADIAVVDLDRSATTRIMAASKGRSFAEVFGEGGLGAPLIDRGDLVGVTIWEAPPAVLFTGAGSMGGATDGMAAQGSTVPDQRVDQDGAITVPFVGKVAVAGRTPAQVQRDIVGRLNGRAHDPQALVRVIDNDASTVTVLGKVAATRRVPLTVKGERLLDVLAEAGGPTEEVGKITVRLTRGARAATMPLDAVILDPAQNVALHADDVLTVIHQPFSFIALGAVQRTAEVPFEGAGFTLAQALGRVGGLRDDRADIRGVFLFRWEDPAALDPGSVSNAQTAQDGRVPVVYRLDLSDPAGLFVAQDFVMRDDDVLYVSTAPGADLQRFLATLSGVALSTIAIGNSF
jgi:polysaccharide biosynthesis/export protein